MEPINFRPLLAAAVCPWKPTSGLRLDSSAWTLLQTACLALLFLLLVAVVVAAVAVVAMVVVLLLVVLEAATSWLGPSP